MLKSNFSTSYFNIHENPGISFLPLLTLLWILCFFATENWTAFQVKKKKSLQNLEHFVLYVMLVFSKCFHR